MAENGVKCYDISMLRDFLDHLLCELRIAQSPCDVEVDVQPDDLIALRDVYRRKYNSPGLLEQSALEQDLSTQLDMESASSMLAKMFSEMRDVELRRMEELQGLFEEALRCCRQAELPVRLFSAAEVLENAPSAKR